MILACTLYPFNPYQINIFYIQSTEYLTYVKLSLPRTEHLLPLVGHLVPFSEPCWVQQFQWPSLLVTRWFWRHHWYHLSCAVCSVLSARASHFSAAIAIFYFHSFTQSFSIQQTLTWYNDPYEGMLTFLNRLF